MIERAKALDPPPPDPLLALRCIQVQMNVSAEMGGAENHAEIVWKKRIAVDTCASSNSSGNTC